MVNEDGGVVEARTGTSCWATLKMFDIIPSARPLKVWRGSDLTTLVFWSSLEQVRRVKCRRPG